MAELRRGVVTNVDDPKGYGRIRARVNGFSEQRSETPWAWPCSPLAGNGWGFFMLPQVGDEVWLVRSHEGDWIYLGYFWSDRKPKPTEGATGTRIFKTPSGHKMSFTESGSILIQTAGGSGKIEMKANGDIALTGGEITLNGSAGKVVTTECVCSATGGKHPQGVADTKAG